MTTPLAQVIECDCCDGRGVVRAHSLTEPAEPPQVITCPLCQGLGARLVPRETT